MMLAIMLLADGGPQSTALAHRIDATAGARVVAVESSGCSALDRLEEVRAVQEYGWHQALSEVDVILLDADSPSIDGPAVARHLREQCHVPVVMLVASCGDERVLREALSAGVSGCLTKDCSMEEMVASLRRAAHHGDRVLSQGAIEVLIDALVHETRMGQMQEALAQRAEELPPRLRQVYTQVIAGASNHHIARLLGLTENTVRVYVSDLLHRLGFRARTELIAAHTGHAWSADSQA